MSYRSIFGQDLTDYDIEVIVEDPVVRTWWMQTKGRQHVLQKWQYDRSMRGTMMNLLKSATKVAGVGSAIYAALAANKERPKDFTHTGNFPGQSKIDRRREHLRSKRKSFSNLP